MELNTLSGLIIFGVLAGLITAFLVAAVFFGNDGISDMIKTHEEAERKRK